MATDLKVRSAVSIRGDQFGGGLAGAFALHGAVVAALLGWAYLSHSGQSWGNNTTTAGAIQATMVNSLPLPPKPADQDSVLATDTPSPAPVVPAPQTAAVPTPDAVPIPVKPTKPVKTADKTAPPPPLHPQPAKVDPAKVQTGEAPAMRIAMDSTQTHAGTISVGTEDAAFGAIHAYYVQQITQKVAAQWFTGMLDQRAAGHRVYIKFEVERDGTLSHIRIAQPSGDATLDQTALSAVQHIDTFGPLPDAYTGSHIDVTYYFDPPPRP